MYHRDVTSLYLMLTLTAIWLPDPVEPQFPRVQPRVQPQLHGNPRVRCPPKCLCFSTTVRCMFLQLEKIPDVPSTTTILDLRFNKIRTIPPGSFAQLKSLNTLLLNNNHITKLHNGAFRGLTNLRYLYLYKNRIRHIENLVFKNLARLEQLYLHFNDLGTFYKDTFKDLVSMQRLFLHNNRLQSVPRGAFKNLKALKRLRLDSNALVCDCQLLWLAKMVKDKHSHTQVAATCEFPSGLQGKSITSLNGTQFQCKGLPEITEEPSDVEVNFGGTAYFTCKVDGDPQPEVIWLHNNEVISETPRVSVLTDGTLMIANTQGRDTGFYECRATNPMGDVYSRKAKILMSDAAAVPTRSEPVASRPRFVRLPSDRNVTKGSSLELECAAVGIPQPDITWTKDNAPLPLGDRIKIRDGGNLALSETKRSDSGLYRCLSSNHLGRVTATARIQILILPRFSTEPKDAYASEGSTVTFACEADGEPSPIMNWYRNEVLILPSARFNIFVGGNRLRIQDVKRFDEGEFVCKAKNGAGTVQAEASLFVRDKLAPIIKSEPRDVTVRSGHDMELPCDAQGLPVPTVTWKKDGHQMTNSEKHRVDSDGSLRVFNVSASDQGIYECSATNYVGYASARATLTVTAVPVVHLGDTFLEESYEEARNKVNKAYNDTISKLFSTSRTQPPNPHELLRIFRFPQAPGRDIARIAETIEQTLNIVQRHVEAGATFNLTKFSYEDLLSPVKLRALADISGCLVHRRSIFTCDDMCFNLKYRTLDGTCNNLNNPMWGASLIGFRREMPPIYENGFNTPVGWSQTKKYFGFFKPSARVVSTRLLSTENISPDSHCTHMLMQWGQFLDHDIDHALPAIATESFRTGVPCQRSCDYSAPCFPIEIPTDDPRVRHRCMEFTRSSAVCGSGVSSVLFDKVLPREQINQLTSFIDGSQIYSSSNIELSALRNLTYPYGQLRGGISGETGKPLLPFSNGLPIDCRRDHTESAVDCFLAGDIRANEQVGLLSMHILWFREHNRISDELRFLNPHWDGDTLFHESRKILGATIQHITFNHWLPHILGPGGMDKLGPHTGYNPQVDPTISNVFATAAFRFGHTLINPELQRLNATFQPIAKGHLPLHKAFFSPWRIVEEGGIDPILRGLLATPAKSKVAGQFLNTELTEKLFRAAHEIALDLAAINVQRGRDHALPGYTHWRRFCNLSVPESFDDLADTIGSREIRTKLRQLYGHPGNIDLFVGSLLEDPIDGGRVGPTVSCLLIKQFRSLREGDRFWYENPWVFKPEQLDQIKQATLAKVMCDNGDNITDVTRDVFVLPQEQTPAFVPCSTIPQIDLRLWSECCKDCKNAGFFGSLSRSSTHRFRREAEFSYKDDRSPYLAELEDLLFSNDIPINSSSFSAIPQSNIISNSILNPLKQSPLPQRRNDRFFSDIFELSDDEAAADTEAAGRRDAPSDPLEGYVKDVTEERIEGVEALVEQLTNTVQNLMRKIRRLEKLHGVDNKASRRKTCADEEGNSRRRGETWRKGECDKCVCRPKGVRCRVITCPQIECDNPVKEKGSCCPKCN